MTRVFLSENAELVLAYPVCILDDTEPITCYDMQPKDLAIGMMEVSGYLIEHPEIGGFKIFMNKKWCDERFEDLGGL